MSLDITKAKKSMGKHNASKYITSHYVILTLPSRDSLSLLREQQNLCFFSETKQGKIYLIYTFEFQQSQIIFHQAFGFSGG